MNAQRMTMTIAGLFILVSLGLGQLSGQIDIRPFGWLWLTTFVGLNLFQSGITGFCPMTKILVRLGMRPGC